MRDLRLRIQCRDPKIDITVQMGDGPATPTAGNAAWEVIERVEGPGVTDRTGRAPFSQDVPVLLDGYAKGNSVQRQLDRLLALRESVFKVDGPIHRPNLHYVYGAEPDFGEVIRDDDGTLLRQRLTLHLMEFVRPDVLGRRKRRRPKSQWGIVTYSTAPGGSTYITKQGDTLAKITARLYGDWKLWRQIGNKNGIRDPYRVLPPGRVLKL